MIRETKQKSVLLVAVDGMTSFFSADEIHTKVKPENIGIATVYRFLKNRVEQGELHSYSCNGKTVYSTNKSNHCHFTCEICGEVRHLPAKRLDFLPREWKGEICHVQIDVTGVCEHCSRKKCA